LGWLTKSGLSIVLHPAPRRRSILRRPFCSSVPNTSVIPTPYRGRQSASLSPFSPLRRAARSSDGVIPDVSASSFLRSSAPRETIELLPPRSTRPHRASAGVIFSLLPGLGTKPQTPSAIAFIDGQNLFHAAKNAFGYAYPNFDIQKLSETVCSLQGWQLRQSRFYTGIPDPVDDPFWHGFWRNKLAMMGRRHVHVFSRPLRYRRRTVVLPGGTTQTLRLGEEKGIDVRIAIDVIRLAHRQAFDVAVIFSHDQDLSEVAAEVREIAREQTRWIKVASALPWSAKSTNARGIDKTDWIRIDKATYDTCRDLRDYRPAATPKGTLPRATSTARSPT
jgi:uncharacterized LabA/DUF88 family protein